MSERLKHALPRWLRRWLLHQAIQRNWGHFAVWLVICRCPLTPEQVAHGQELARRLEHERQELRA